MIGVTAAAFQQVLARGSLREAAPGTGFGRELTFRDRPAREIVVHFGERDSAQYMRDVTERILALDDAWLLLPRHGAVASLELLHGDAEAAAIRFGPAERSTLAEYLCTRPMSLSEVSADLYAVSDSGRILLTWDHHTADEGLSIQLHDVADATRLLGALNELGAELELFYTDPIANR
jgi:hypothetical protein